MQIEDKRKAEIANMPRKELNAHAFLLEMEQEEYEVEKRALLSTIEGLKGENERLTKENKLYHDGVVAIHDEEKAALREEVERYRTALEDIIGESGWGNPENSLGKVTNIARKALGESHDIT